MHERKHGQAWYLPAGRKEPFLTFAEAALRETQEEAGIDIVLEGVVAPLSLLDEGSAEQALLKRSSSS